MDIQMFIRSIIFLVAGLVLILFPEKVLKFHVYCLKKLHIKHSDSKSTNKVLGIIFLIIAVILFIISI